MAYAKLYANKGALTPGTDPEDTVDGMSLRKIETMIKNLQEKTYQWKPTRRVYIPKKNGRLRPLGMPITVSYSTSFKKCCGFTLCQRGTVKAVLRRQCWSLSGPV